MNRWILAIESYEGVQKNAVNMLSGYLSGLLSYTLPVAIYAQILWSPTIAMEDILEIVSKNPFVENE